MYLVAAINVGEAIEAEALMSGHTERVVEVACAVATIQTWCLRLSTWVAMVTRWPDVALDAVTLPAWRLVQTRPIHAWGVLLAFVNVIFAKPAPET